MDFLDFFDINDEEHAKDIEQFRANLHKDYKKWIVAQIKMVILLRGSHIFLTKINKKDWKRIFHPKVFHKRFIPKTEYRYYDQYSKVFITNKNIRTIIDFIMSLGLKWQAKSSNNENKFLLDYDYVIGVIDYVH